MRTRTLPATNSQPLIISLSAVALLALSPAPATAQQQTKPPAQSPADRRPDLSQDADRLIERAEQGFIDIPPVMERPLGMDEGPRVRVSRFDLTGAVDRKKYDIQVTELEAILNNKVAEQPAEGFTINQLQAVADDLTRHYRERGMILATAIIPAQEVDSGVVAIKVLEGTLDQVRVEGGRLYKPRLVERPFRRLKGEPIGQRSIERALLDVQNYPGLTVFGTFTEGTAVGTTDLVVRVRDEKRLTITPSFDNYGSDITGEYRGTLDAQLNNTFGLGDQLSAYILQTFEPTNGTYGGGSFSVPFGRHSIAIGAATNQYDVGQIDDVLPVDVEGVVDRFDLSYAYALANGRYFGANARLGVALKEAKTEVDNSTVAKDNLTVVTGGGDFFWASRKTRGFLVGALDVRVGLPDTLGSMSSNGDGESSRIGSGGDRAGGDFFAVDLDLQYLQRITNVHSVLLRANGLWTDDLLVALEQFSIGGPLNVRAYPVASVLSDRGFSGSIEWLMNAPGFSKRRAFGNRTWGEILQVSVYADYAYGELEKALEVEEENFEFSGFGGAIQLNFPGKLFARFDVSSPLGSRKVPNDNDPQYWGRMSFTF